MRQGERARAKRRQMFWRRTLAHAGIAFGILGGSLAFGIWGYEHYEHMLWRDALLNAAMLLGGMGPVETKLSDPGKVFAAIYALYSGLVVIALTGLLLGPGVHYLMHRVHWEEAQESK